MTSCWLLEGKISK